MKNDNSSTKQSVLEKHDSLQKVQASTASVLAVAVKEHMHTMFSSAEHTGAAQKSTKRGFKAKRASITRTTRAPEDVPEVPAAGS